jgi:hypothetical protein
MHVKHATIIEESEGVANSRPDQSMVKCMSEKENLAGIAVVLPTLSDNLESVEEAISQLTFQLDQIVKQSGHYGAREVSGSATKAFARIWGSPPFVAPRSQPRDFIGEVVKQLKRYANILNSENLEWSEKRENASPSLNELRKRVDTMIEALDLLAQNRIVEARNVARALHSEERGLRRN